MQEDMLLASSALDCNLNILEALGVGVEQISCIKCPFGKMFGK